LDEDNTKLFFDENIIKKSFQKKNNIVNYDKSDDFNKKKLQKKSIADQNDDSDSSSNMNLLSALNAPTSIVEIKEHKLNQKREVILFNENEIELGFKHKRNVKEFVKAIIDKQIRVEIIATIPENEGKKSELRKKQKSRLLYIRTFLVNQGISHNRIRIKFDKGSDLKISKNEVVLSFIGL